MADRKISELTNITGANLADDDEFALVDTSADETKAITFGEFKTALDTATGFVRITGDTMTGNLTVPNVVVSGNVDGRDVSADGTKLDTVETNADVTDTANVTAAGALMDSELANLAAVKAIDQGLSTSDSPSFDAVTVGSTSDPSSEMTILSSIGGTSELRLGDTDADAGSIKYFNSSDQLVLRAAAETRVVVKSTGAAVTGKTTTDELDLNAISETISDTAVDVFVYDTRKDSDGGAWRKRTQHTSWYNEAASSTRGSRKEFPAVAVIVLENYALSIYDGDDPDLPLWKEMTMTSAANTYWFGFGAGYPFPKAVSALNGEISLVNNDTGNSSAGLTRVRFIQDDIYRNAYSISYSGKYAYNIANYSTINGSYDQNANIIVNNRGNDVAMTVLPNAPIDAATGLPVPTIAVATDGGVSVIKDDETVVDITGASGYSVVEEIDFTYNNKIVYSLDGTGSPRSVRVDSIPSSDFNVTTNQLVKGNGEEFYTGADFGYSVGDLNIKLPSGAGVTKVSGAKPNAREVATSVGMTRFLLENQADPASGLANFTTSDYNTGWQNGDIKLATLSDTDDTDVTGSDYTSTFSTVFSTSGRVTSYSYTNGSNTVVLDDDGVSAGDGFVALAFTPTVSGRFLIKMVADNSFTPTTGYSNFVRIGTTGTVLDTLTATEQSDLTNAKYLEFDGVSGTQYTFNLYSNYSGGNLTYTFNIYKAEEDRSVNGNGLQVFGTVTKNPVATGADLVAYSGFSASNYLEQPYNSDLDFGTGDFCIMGWWKFTSDNAYDIFIDRGYYTGGSYSGNGYNFISGSGNSISFRNNTTGILSIGSQPTNVWFCLCVVRRNGVFYSYINGVQQSTASNTDDFTNTNATLRVGLNQVGDVPANASAAALWRISATAPSPEQIKKIYEDEKHLFQENAQATLYGSSDAVTALAYDDTTELLHVGTSAGRSVFQGLRRVDNTTDAVGAAISASNGLVADE